MTAARASSLRSDPSPTRTVGIAWYKRDHYAEVRLMMADGHVLPEDYGTWLREAQKVATIEEAQGSAIVKALIVPKQFIDWCRATRQKPDVHARTRHVNAAIEDFCRRR